MSQRAARTALLGLTVPGVLGLALVLDPSQLGWWIVLGGIGGGSWILLYTWRTQLAVVSGSLVARGILRTRVTRADDVKPLARFRVARGQNSPQDWFCFSATNGRRLVAGTAKGWRIDQVEGLAQDLCVGTTDLGEFKNVREAGRQVPLPLYVHRPWAAGAIIAAVGFVAVAVISTILGV